MNKRIFLIILLATSSLVFSQKKKKGKLDTEEISVIKPYTPTVSDATKIKVGPEIDSVELAKKELNYKPNTSIEDGIYNMCQWINTLDSK